MGGAQPLAAVMAGAHCLAIECQESRIEKRLETRYLDRRASSLNEALEIIRTATEPTSVGVLGPAAAILPALVNIVSASFLASVCLFVFFSFFAFSLKKQF